MSRTTRTIGIATALALANFYLVYVIFINRAVTVEVAETKLLDIATGSGVSRGPSTHPGDVGPPVSSRPLDEQLDIGGEELFPLIQDNLNKLKEAQKTERTVVLIVSDFRSGSSILGEMFNQNDNVFYMFEPLKGMVPAAKKLLTDIFTCTPKKWGFMRRNRQSGCSYVEGLYNSQTMDCLKTINSTQECLKYPITAAKFIRLRSIEMLKDFGLLWRPNLFIVHSFRDPRGTINSRLQFGDVVNYNGIAVPRDLLTTETVGSIASSLCQRYYEDVVFGETIKDKYIRIGYEDLCVDPDSNIRKVYSLIGHQPPERVFQWYSAHTHSRSTSAASDKMGLARDATRTAERWKHELPREYICAIEQNCGKLFDYLGLQYVCSDAE